MAGSSTIIVVVFTCFFNTHVQCLENVAHKQRCIINTNATKRTKKPQSGARKNQSFEFLPKMMIFEPDRVFWPFHVETEVVPPFGMRRYQPTTKRRRTKARIYSENFRDKELVDRNGTFLTLYPEAPEVLVKLLKKGVKVSVAETTPEIATIRHVLHLFDLDHFFSHMEIDLESPVDHVKVIKNESGIDFSDLVYLGSNLTALNEIKKELKVLTVYVKPNSGLTVLHMYKAIYLYTIWPKIELVEGRPQFVGEIASNEITEEEHLSREKQLKPTDKNITKRPLDKPTLRIPRTKPKVPLKSHKKLKHTKGGLNDKKRTKRLGRKIKKTNQTVKTPKGSLTPKISPSAEDMKSNITEHGKTLTKHSPQKKPSRRGKAKKTSRIKKNLTQQEVSKLPSDTFHK